MVLSALRLNQRIKIFYLFIFTCQLYAYNAKKGAIGDIRYKYYVFFRKNNKNG